MKQNSSRAKLMQMHVGKDICGYAAFIMTEQCKWDIYLPKWNLICAYIVKREFIYCRGPFISDQRPCNWFLTAENN